MPHMSRVTAGKSSIKVSAVALRLSCTRRLCTVIMADSTTGYGVINNVPPVIAGCVRGTFSPNFNPNKPLLLQLSTCSADERGRGAGWLHPELTCSCSFQPDAPGTGVILQADSEPGRDGVEPLSPLLSGNVLGNGGFRGGSLLRGSVYIVRPSAPFSSVVTLQGYSAHWGKEGKGKWKVMIPAVHVLDADANAAWRGSIGNIFFRLLPL